MTFSDLQNFSTRNKSSVFPYLVKLNDNSSYHWLREPIRELENHYPELNIYYHYYYYDYNYYIIITIIIIKNHYYSYYHNFLPNVESKCFFSFREAETGHLTEKKFLHAKLSQPNFRSGPQVESENY